MMRTSHALYWAFFFFGQLLTQAIMLGNDVIILRKNPLHVFPELMKSVSNSIQVHLDIRSSSEII